MTRSASLTLAVGSPPSSSDPLEHDQISNTIVFSATSSGLISNLRKGEYQGLIAESWTQEDSFRRWEFKVRPGLTFEDGEPITAETVVASWRRLERLMRERGSKSGLFEFAASYEARDGGFVELRFTKPFPKLLDILSDGLYAVAHPGCYASETGTWSCSGRAISSGAYRVARWDAEGVDLALREDFPAEFRHPRAARTVRIRWDADSRAQADLVFGTSEDRLDERGLAFVGGARSGIAFLRCQSWSRPESPVGDRLARAALRDSFYKELARVGLAPVRSFFPPSIPGIRELPAGPATEPAPALGAGTLRFRPFPSHLGHLAAATPAMAAAARRRGLRFAETSTTKAELREDYAPGLPRYRDDVAYGATEVTLENPRFSVRFMFLSKEGIRLPDPGGHVARVLAREEFDLQEINEILWDDAVIWPVSHFGWGTWAKPDVDLGRCNQGLIWPALQWAGVGR